MLGMNASGQDITVGVYRNNLALGAQQFSNRNNADEVSNSWTIAGITVSAADFQSVATTGMDAPRRADGSLPMLPNFRLAPGSDLIDKGTVLKFPFAGKAPDLGAFEVGLEEPVPGGSGAGGSAGTSGGGASSGASSGGSSVGGAPSSAGAGGAAIGGAGVGTGGSDSTSAGSPPHSAGAPNGAGAPSASAGSSTGGDTPTEGDAGCACRAAASRPGSAGGLVLVLLLALGRRRR
jgi:MYXO-CTERM domain-containing protein